MVRDNTQDKTVKNLQLKKIKKSLENRLKIVILFPQQSAFIIIMRYCCVDSLRKEPHYVTER